MFLMVEICQDDFDGKVFPSIRLMSTECNSAIRAAIQQLILGTRISAAVKVVDSKYSSIRPL